MPLYLAGGIFGALLFMLTYNLSPAFQTDDALLVGASTSILALVIAAATLAPDYTVSLILIGPVKLKYIAFVALLLDIISISANNNAGGHIAHLGGAITGYLFIVSYKKGINWFGWWFSIVDKIKERRKGKLKVVNVNKENNYRPRNTIIAKEVKQKKMDEILDKISQSGYDSLTKEEKDYLFKISNE